MVGTVSCLLGGDDVFWAVSMVDCVLGASHGEFVLFARHGELYVECLVW